MNLVEINERLIQIGERLGEIPQEQASSGRELARAQGVDPMSGISIDPLTEWARKMRSLNIESYALVQERKELREMRRSLKAEETGCSCSCH